MSLRTLVAVVLALNPVAIHAQVPEPDSATPRPVAPFVVSGGCPFECCRYGNWWLRSRGVVHRQPTREGRPIATLRTGTRIIADSGVVIIAQLGVVAIRRPYHDPDMQVDYSAGDTLVLLDYVGEGFFNAWYRGHMRQVSAYWGRQDTSAAQLVAEPRGEWWAHIGWTVGARKHYGWLDMKQARVGGADACGSPALRGDHDQRSNDR